MVAFRDKVVDAMVLASPPQDRGTGRCRLSKEGITQMGAKPGDAVVVLIASSQKAFLCSLYMLAKECDSSESSPRLKTQIDCCIEFPAASICNSEGQGGEAAHGIAFIRPLKSNLGIAQTVSLRGEGIDGDPSPAVRVAIAAALERHVICRGALLTVPTVGVIAVAATSPDNGAVTAIGKTRVTFLNSTPPSSSPSPVFSPATLAPQSPQSPPARGLPATDPSSPTPSSPAAMAALTPLASSHSSSALKARPSPSPSKPLLLPFSPHSPLARSTPALAAASRPPRAEEVFVGEEQAVAELRDTLRLIFDRMPSLEEMGLRAAGGVLIHGPSGTGKKLLVAAVAAEVGARVVRITPSEVYQAGAGEGEALLREKFKAAAEEGRVVVLLEEVHRLCPRRQAGREREARVVGQMLSLLDGGKSDRQGVAVVGLSSNPQRLDMAMRRPGRLDKELGVGAPTVEGRLEMLRRFARRLPLEAPQQLLPQVAAMCVGFVGADLRILCANVGGTCIARALCDGGEEGAGGDGRGGPVQVGLQDWERGVRAVAARGGSGGGGGGVEEGQGAGLESVGGLGEVKEVLRRAVAWPLVHAALFKRMALRASRGVLLHGPPGCGKTKLVRAAARTAGVGFIQVSGAEVMSCLLGESERMVRELFARGRRMRPCLLFIDEIDALVAKRALDGSGDGGESGGVQQRLLSTLLNEMDGVEDTAGVLLVGATNRLDMIDPALLRPGRFDHLLAVPLPDAEGRTDVLLKCSQSMPLAVDVDLGKLAGHTDGYSGAELERLCQEAAMVALRKSISATEVCALDFEEAQRRVLPASGGG